MKTALALLFASALAAQTQPKLEMHTVGPWPLCETTPQYGGILCAGFVPGHELYMITIPNNGAVGYRYTVTVVLVSTGETVTLSDVVRRVDDAIGWTPVVLNFGGIVRDWTIKVEDLAVIGIRMREAPARQ